MTLIAKLQAQLHNANAQLEHQQQVLMQQQQAATQFLQAQNQAVQQQQQAAVVAAQIQQQQIAAVASAVAASQCLPPSTIVHSMLQPPSVVDLVVGASAAASVQSTHSTNLVGHPTLPQSMVVGTGGLVSSCGAAGGGLVSAVAPHTLPPQPQQILAPNAFMDPMGQVQPSAAALLAGLGAPMDTTTSPPVRAQPVVNATNNVSQEMVAIPKDVLMKLVEHRIENDQQQQQQMEAAKPVKCQCHCQCGRYPHDVLIVDKVGRDF
jgi:hypothetical protein